MRHAPLATLAAAVTIAMLLPTTPAASEAKGVAHFREVEVSHSVLGDFAGATETWRTRVLLRTVQQAVGTGAVTCVRVEELTSARECVATYILPRGRIQLAGEIVTRSAYQLTITGGTGIYAAAGGVAIFLGPQHAATIVFYLGS